MAALRFGWSLAVENAGLSRHTGDPLGFRAWANRVTRDLTPGVTNTTNRVQGYALFCAGVHIAAQAARTHGITADEAFRRFETLWVHAQTRYGLDDDTISRWPGSRSAARLAADHEVDLSASLLSQPLTSGIFGPYRRSARRFGLTHLPLQGGAIRPGTVKLTGAGTELAELCLRNLWIETAGGKGPLLKLLRTGRATGAHLQALRPDTHPRLSESAVISTCLGGVDRLTRDGLAMLRRCYDRNPDLLKVLSKPTDLTPPQTAARTSAQAILRLVAEVERPYREWLSGDDTDAPPASLWDDTALWADVEAGGGADALELRAAGHANRGWDGVHQWQQRLADLRGGEPLLRRYVPPDYGTAAPPEFGLVALGWLFDDGLLNGSLA